MYDIPTALPDGATSTTSEGHDPHGADWNDPQIVWVGDLHLNCSKPLRVPLVWIYWYTAHHLPVYTHPDYKPIKESLHAPTAQPHARLAKLFSDASAAAARVAQVHEEQNAPNPGDEEGAPTEAGSDADEAVENVSEESETPSDGPA